MTLTLVLMETTRKYYRKLLFGFLVKKQHLKCDQGKKDGKAKLK